MSTIPSGKKVHWSPMAYVQHHGHLTSSSMDKPNVIQWDSVKTFRKERKRRPQRIWKKEARYPLGLHSPFE